MMTDYSPTPYMAARAARLDTLTALRRPLTDAEQGEVMAIQAQLRWAACHWRRQQTDPAYREIRAARARLHSRMNYGTGARA